jgi:small subunit ribosomal protein S15
LRLVAESGIFHLFHDSDELKQTLYERANDAHGKVCRMALVKERKTEIIDTYKRGDADTGSPEVQVALLTERITQLTEHFKVNKKDYHSRQGLLKVVSRRRRLLDYVKGIDVERYKTLIAQLGIRR